MIFQETQLKGAFIIEPDKYEDERGFFARTWCKKEFASHGLNPNLFQCNISFNKRKGTLRGMHYQVKPYEEAKLVRCTMGAIYDVIIDMRKDSPTYTKWMAVELTDENRKMLYIPEDFGHGFQTLKRHAEVFYQMSEYFVPEYSKGIRWNDPFFAIEWPEDERSISLKDKQFQDFSP